MLFGYFADVDSKDIRLEILLNFWKVYLKFLEVFFRLFFNEMLKTFMSTFNGKKLVKSIESIEFYKEIS